MSDEPAPTGASEVDEQKVHAEMLDLLRARVEAGDPPIETPRKSRRSKNTKDDGKPSLPETLHALTENELRKTLQSSTESEMPILKPSELVRLVDIVQRMAEELRLEREAKEHAKSAEEWIDFSKWDVGDLRTFRELHVKYGRRQQCR